MSESTSHGRGDSASAGRRASDADRDQVVTWLQEAISDGRLDTDEFGERMGAAYAAKTHGELAPLTADLDADARVIARKDEATIRALSSSVRREGRWQVPRRLVIEAERGSLLIDLTDADLPGSRLDLVLNARYSSLRLQLPAGAEIDHDELVLEGSSWSPPHGTALDTLSAPSLRVRITGDAHRSSIVVRDRLGRWARWRRRRAQRRQRR